MSNYIIHDMKQGTDEWLRVRCGKLTASDIFKYKGNAIVRTGLIYDKASERITKKIPIPIYSKDMQRGNDLEGEALVSYEYHNDVKVKQVGFIELNKFIGCSPDGLIEDDGVIEVKAPNSKLFLQQVVNGIAAIPKLYIYQMQMIMYISERKWCDYYIYNTSFKNKGHSIRINRDEDIIEDIKNIIERSNNEIQYIINNYEEKIK